MSDEELSKFIADEMDRGSKLFKGAVCKVLKDVRAEIEALGIWHDKVMIETVDINRVLEVIDDKIKEIKRDTQD